jgi:hypothetical protein
VIPCWKSMLNMQLKQRKIFSSRSRSFMT